MHALLLLLFATLCAAQTPGKFDYYVLALSWSPEYCASQGGSRDKLQCVDRRYGFVTHGLWPQYEKGYPRGCRGSAALSNDTVKRMLDIMPSPSLVRHEWQAHGTCSGLTPGVYFETLHRYYGSIRIPKAFQEPTTTILIEPSVLKQRFLESNTAFERTMSYSCRRAASGSIRDARLAGK